MYVSAVQGVALIRSRQARLRLERRKSFESGYFRFLICFLCLVVVLQGLLRFDSIRPLLNKTIWLEGQPLAKTLRGIEEPIYTWIQWPPAGYGSGSEVGVICLKFIGDQNDYVWVLVNGKTAKKLVPEDGVILCRDGDLVEIVAEKGLANIVVSAVSVNVLSPSVGTWVKGRGVLSLGRAQLAHP
ncbi:MAG: hypothetical protein ACOX35_01570 [Bacillota bacterium]|nr:hypothetical protein [Candidatus Fermentithermobacillaceae bacterium]